MNPYRLIHRYGKWSIVEYVKNDRGFYASRTIVEPTTKKLAEVYLRLLGV